MQLCVYLRLHAPAACVSGGLTREPHYACIVQEHIQPAMLCSNSRRSCSTSLGGVNDAINVERTST